MTTGHITDSQENGSPRSGLSRRAFLGAAAATFGGLVLVACGTPSASTGASTGAATSAGAKIPLKFTFWGSPQEKAAVENAIAAYQELNPNIAIEALHIPGDDFLQKLNAMIAGNEAPDLSYSAAWKLKMGEEGLLHNFFDLMKEDPTIKKEDYLKYAWWNWDTDKSAGPYQAAVVPSLMYNVDMFDAANVPYPPTKVEDAWTWQEFIDVAKQLTLDRSGRNAHDPDFDPNDISQFGAQVSLNWYGWMPFVFGNGGGYLTEDGTEFGLSKPEATEALQLIADLINVHHVSPSPVQASSIPAPATALQSKKVAMVIEGSWNHLDLVKAGLNWGVGVMPVLKEYKSFFFGGSLVIFKSSEHPDETWQFIKFLTNPHNVLEMFQALWVPQMTAWYEDPELIELWASETLPGRPTGFQDAVMHATFDNVMPSPENDVRNFLEINAAVSAALDQVWLGTKSAADAMAEIEPQVAPLVQGFYLER